MKLIIKLRQYILSNFPNFINKNYFQMTIYILSRQLCHIALLHEELII